MYIIIQSYNEMNNQRQRELQFCLRQLLHNPQVTQVTDLSELQKPAKFYNDLVKHRKYKFVPNNEWLTYNRAIVYAYTNFPQGELVGLLNNDIFPGKRPNWSELKTAIHSLSLKHNLPVIVTQTRYEWGGTEATSTLDPSFNQSMGSNSQDGWFWLNHRVLPSVRYEIPIGILGCDNAFAHRLFTGNVIPYNLGNKWRIYHYDKCRQKTGLNSKNFHNKNAKQRSKGYEQEGNLVVPFFDCIPNLKEKLFFIKNYKSKLDSIIEPTIEYIVILKLLMKYVDIQN